jgi:peptidoglycan-associated lipoprotein
VCRNANGKSFNGYKDKNTMKITTKLSTLAAVALLLSACASGSGNTGADGSTLDGANGSGNTDGRFSQYGTDLGDQAGAQKSLEENAGSRVFFGYDSFALTAEGTATLAKQAEWLKKYSGVNVTVEGHADERGTREYNLALGERRANATKTYLVGQGVAETRVNTVSYGKERPEAQGSTEAAWSQNRRSVTVVD